MPTDNSSDRTRTTTATTAIIGAGIAGMTAARVLADQGRDAIVFEKSRGPGGRAARRRIEDLEFDHGAQYFTARSPVFLRQLESLWNAGVVEQWTGRVVSLGGDEPVSAPVRFVGVPGMSTFAREIGRGVEVKYCHRLRSIRRAREGGWMLQFPAGVTAGPFESVLVTPPAPQTAELLERVCPDLAEAIRTVRMMPCWALMLAFDRRLDVDFDAAVVESPGPIRWLARSASKPGRPPGETWVIHARPEWSRENLERSPGWVRDRMDEALDALIGARPRPTLAVAHRWRYAMVDRPLGVTYLFDHEQRIGAAGDWCLGPRIESAFLSGFGLANAVGPPSGARSAQRRR